MRNKYVLFLLSTFISGFCLAQNVQIFDENFETGGGTFFLNAPGVGTNTGTNEWTVNNSYIGGTGYSKTISEDSTFGGTISFAPHSYYLHIYDATSPYTDDNYGAANASDHFAYTWEGMCTLGLYNVSLNFFYVCQGSSTAYGQVYYSKNNGPWTAVGAPQYSNKYKWQYTTITNPVFDNTSNLQFGFRWINNAGAAGPDTSSMGIDDVTVVGKYDSVAHPVNINVSTQDSVCQGGFLYINYKLSDSLCDGQYTIQLSNAAGSFTTPLENWVYWIYYPNDSGTVPVQIPTFGVPVGACYKIRIIRNSPAPVIIGTASNCFSVIACPNTITTLQPVVTMDTNAVCAGSVIDIPFYSTGTYTTYNNYWAELSDSAGNFTGKYDTVGLFSSSTTYDPSTGSMPGTVSGLLPTNIPSGCNYYIRVVSDTPTSIGTKYGPFCIQHCDIFTNNQQSLLACISSCYKEPKGYSDTILYNVHKFDSLAKYSSNNKFEVQLLSSMNFSLVNNGGFGVVADTVSGKLYVHIPCADSLTSLGIAAGLYYMRIVATGSSFSDSSLGSLVHLTIGEPADSLVIYSGTGTFTYCVGDVGEFIAFPWDFTSQYYWFDNGTEFNWTQNPIFITLNGAFSLQVQENSFGCYGPKSPPVKINVKGPPNVTVAGTPFLCAGDTGTFSVPFSNNTYYTWRTKYASSIDTANNIIKLVFDSVGTFKVTIIAIDSCGADSSSRSIIVKASPKPVITGSTILCKGTSTTLTASGGSGYTWSTKTTGSSLTTMPLKDSTYWVKVSNGTCATTDTVKIQVIPSPTVTVVPNNHLMCAGDTLNLIASGALSYIWAPNIFLNNDTLSSVIATPTVSITYTVTGKGANNCTDTASAKVIIDVPATTISSSVAITDGQSINLISTGGGTYEWVPTTGLSCTSCPDPIASPTVTTTYSVVITDADNCSKTDTVTVDVEAKCGSIFVPEAFSPNGDGKNDILYVRYNCIKNLDFIVFDRWGNKVFETTDPNMGWDGTYKGEAMNTGTYVYSVTVETFDNKTLSAKGNVTLVR